MPGQVKLVVTAEMAQAFSAFSKLVEQTGKAERGMDRLAAAGNRAERAQTAAVQKLVGRVQARTRGAELALSQADRVALRTGFNPGGGALGTAIERRLVAQDLRDQRAFQRYLRDERSAQIGRAAGSMYAMDTLLARGGAALTASRAAGSARTLGAGTVAAWGAYGGAAGGEDRLYARARADVARNLVSMPELAGKVSEQDLENMTARRDGQLQRRQQMHQNVAGGALAVGAAVGGFMRSMDEQMHQYADSLTAYEREVSPLFGVGDNMARRRQIGADVLQTAAGLGVGAGQLAAARFNIESFASDLSPDVKAAILGGGMNFYRLQGSDMRSTTSALTAGYKIVGGELAPGAEGVKQLENRLAYGADVGAFEVEQVTPYLGMVLSAFKGMGYKHTDAISAMILGSHSGARPEQFMTATRNIALLMGEGARTGKFQYTGDAGTDFRQVASMESPEMLGAFGRDTFVIAKAIADNIGALEKHTAAMEAIGGRIDLIGDKLAQRFADPAAGAASTINTANQLKASAPVVQLQDPKMADDIEAYALREAGAALNYGPMAKALGFHKLGLWTEHLFGDSDNPLSQLVRSTAAGEQNLERGVAEAIAAARASKDTNLATRLSLKYGKYTNTFYTNAQGRQIFTGGEEEQEWRRLLGQGVKMSAGKFTTYLSKRYTNPAEADLMLQEAEAGRSFGIFGTGPGLGAGVKGPAPEPGILGGPGAPDAGVTALKQLAPMLVEASRNNIRAASIMAGGGRDTNAHAE